MKTFFEITSINESKGGSGAIKDLNKLQKLELELQDIKRNAVEIFTRATKYELGTKERNKIEQKIDKLSQQKDEVLKDIEFEKLNLRRSLNYLDSDGKLDSFFE